MSEKATFQINVWYVAGLATEILPSSMIERKILGETLLLLRTASGEAKAMGGVCRHRFAPLVQGHFDGDKVTCLYHGLQIDTDGQCVHNPRGDGAINARMNVQSYPLVERYGLLWIWMGDASKADPALIFDDLAFLEEQPARLRADGYLHTRADYRLVLDNLLDASHADFLHPTLLNSSGLYCGVPIVEQDDRRVSVIFRTESSPAQPLFRPFLENPDGLAQQDHLFQWLDGSLVRIRAQVTGLGGQSMIYSDSVHAVTPETENSCHYWFSAVRNFADLGPEVSQQIADNVLSAFVNEDKPILEAVQRELGDRDFLDMHPALLAGDGPSVLVRRRIAKAISAQLEPVG